MCAKDLIEILKKLPKDTIICKTSGEKGCEDLNSAKYFPQYDILYLEPYWARNSRGFIDMADGDAIFFGEDARCPYSKEGLATIRDLARKGKRIVDGKADGRRHRIQVVSHQREKVKPFERVSKTTEFSLIVDGDWVGGLNPLEGKTVICDFEWESLTPEVEKGEEKVKYA